MRYRFDVREPAPFKADIVVDGDKFRLEEALAGPADVSFRCSTETLAFMMYGRLEASVAISQGRLEVEGDFQLASQFSQWFKGI